MEIHNENFKERQEAKKEYYQTKAIEKKEQAEQTINQARKMAEVIPFGQPILLGHHSEQRDRNYRGRIDSTYRKGFETLETSKYYEQKVKTIEADQTIRKDDPEAVTKLKEKIADLETKHAELKATKPNPNAHLLDRDSANMRTCYLTGYKTEIRRCKKRIEEIEALEKLPDLNETINGIKIYTDEGRVKIDFGYKPSEETRTQLKRNGFRWSPFNQVWQAFINAWSIQRAKEIVTNEKKG